MKLILLLLGSLSLALSCNYSKVKTPNAPTDSNANPGGTSITDSQWLTQNLFQARCASCHNGGRQPGGHKFETEKDLLDNVARKTIVAGSPDSSSLYKIIQSGAMPTRGEKATAQELEVLACWITEGAATDSSVCVEKFGLSGTVNPGGNPGGHPGGQPTPTPSPTPTPGPGDDDGGRDDDGDDDHGDDHGDDDHGDDDNGDDDGGDGTGDGGGDGGEVPVVKFSEIQQPIFADRCVGCHNTDAAAKGINLESLPSIQAGGPSLVTCGNAIGSMLYTIVLSDEMPMSSDPLSDDLKLKLKDWINGGCQP